MVANCNLPDVQATFHRSYSIRARGSAIAGPGVDQAEEDQERLDVGSNLAVSLMDKRKYSEAEQMQREVLAVQKQALGVEHPYMRLTSANNLMAFLKLFETKGSNHHFSRKSHSHPYK